MMYAYFDYKLPVVDMVSSEMKVGAFVRKELAALFKLALDDGWDVLRDPLLLMYRQDNYTYTIRLSRQLSDDILDKWAHRGWNIEPLPSWMRAQLAQVFIRATP
jgi:hypothetical protein